MGITKDKANQPLMEGKQQTSKWPWNNHQLTRVNKEWENK